MSYVLIRQLLEVRLNAIAPSLPTAFENVPYTPIGAVPWQRINLLTAQTLNPTFGDGFKRETGILQVSLNYSENAGPSATYTRGEMVRAQFPRGLTLTSGKVRVLIDQAPSFGPAMNDGGWYRLPISIPYLADVYP